MTSRVLWMTPPPPAHSRRLARGTRWVAFFLAGFVFACSGGDGPAGDELSEAPVDSSLVQSGDCPEIRHARHFSISCIGDARVVRTFGELTSFQTGRDAEEVSDIVVLIRRSSEPPALTGDLVGAEVIEVPVGSYAVNNDDMLALTLDFGVADRLVAAGGLAIYDDSVRARVARGEVGQTGYSWHVPPDIEVLLERAADVTFMAMDSPHNVPALERSRELGVTVAPAFIWAERDVLARAEWIRFFSLFFDMEEEASAQFDEIEARYFALRERVSAITEPPSAIWGYHAGDDRWFVMANNLEARLLRDAGVRNVFDAIADEDIRQDGDPISGETLLISGAEAEHWILGDIHQTDLPRGEFMGSFLAWREGRLYHNYARTNWDVNAYDWYEGAIGHPDVLLADLVHLFHPALLPDHELEYFGHMERDGGR